MKAEKITQAEEGITQEGLDGSTSSLIAPGHVLLVVRSGILRHTIPVAVNAVEVALNQDMKAIRLNDEICSSSFLLRWIQGFNDQLLLAWGKQGATVESIEQDYLSRSFLPLPPLTEQLAIATFLDHETAKIDALIAEQQRLIELLQEKRQAVISQAVTKGLNPDAPMKDSGVEWLGEVPEHWEVKRVRHLLKSLSQGSSPNCLQVPAEDCQFGVLKVGCVNQSEFIPQENKALPGDVDPDINSLVLPGDVLMSRGNTKELVGLTTVVPQGTEKLLASDLIFILRFEAVLASPEFIALSLRSDFGRSQIEPQTVGTSASMQKINQSTIKELIVALPPLMEQIGIIESILSSLRMVSCQVQNCSLAIELLQERRSALISAAVTGQIDVRGLVAEASDA
jgi:type I restriction enzyme S subunit